MTDTTIVLGLDGATWNLIDRWIDDLPTISDLIDQGINSELQSVTPPVTSPAWRCYATGKDPNDIGVYWWRQFDRVEREFIGADQIPLTDKSYWEYLSESGKQVAIMGVPLNAPPQEVNGHFIAGGPFADPENYTYPSSLSETLEERFDYQLHPDEYPSVETATNPEIVSDFKSMIEQRFDVAEWILNKQNPDFLNLTLFYLNVMQHKAWDAPEVKQLWMTIDQRIEDLLEGDIDLIIHSDHGLHKVERVFYLNAWLEKQGYLTVNEPTKNRSAISIGRYVADKLGIKEQVGRILPEKIKESLREGSERRLIDSEEYESRIDFDSSMAVGLPQGPVYLLNSSKQGSDELVDDLRSVIDPKSGNRVFEEVRPAEEVYENTLKQNSPDILVQWNKGFEIKNQHSENEELIFGPPYGVVADNAPMGILVANGPSFDQGELDTPMLYDLAPTILHLHNVAIPKDMTGSVIRKSFSSDSSAGRRKITKTSYEQTGQSHHQTAEQDVDNRLQDLGYLE